MKKVLFFLFTLCVLSGAHAQIIAYKGMDSNPRLNEAESAYLQPVFPHAVFSFHDKRIAFKYLYVDTAGIRAPELYRVSKYHYFTQYDNGQHTYAYRLHIMTNAERKRSNGYDAVVVIAERRFERELQQLPEKQIQESLSMRYTEIPDDAGSDNEPVLSAPNAAFFHALYKGRVPATFRFEGKKIAIFDTQADRDYPPQMSIGECVSKTREDLLLHEQAYPGPIYLLNADQKKRTGGYDIIIQTMIKMNVPLETLVRLLEQANSGNQPPAETR